MSKKRVNLAEILGVAWRDANNAESAQLMRRLE
jgi:hypothetical protein